MSSFFAMGGQSTMAMTADALASSVNIGMYRATFEGMTVGL